MERWKPFTDEDDEFLRQNWSSLTIDQLGTRMGRSRNSIAGRIHRLGLPRKIDRTKVVKLRIAHTKSPPPSKNQPLPNELTPPSTLYACTMVDLDRTKCRWPVGDPQSPEFRYCGIGEADFPKVPYCTYHRLAQYNLK